MKQKIEERKKTFAKTKSSELDSNRINKKKTVDTFENHEDIKDSDPEPIIVEVEVPKPKKPLKEKISHEFKVLGNNEFEKKAKVSKLNSITHKVNFFAFY